MSWDIYAIKAPFGVRKVEDIPEGFSPPPVGDTAAVVESIQRAAPHADVSDPTWLRIQGDDHSIEVYLGKGVRVHDVTFYVSSGEGSVAVVRKVCRELGITAYDTETGEVLSAESRPPTVPPPDADETAGGKRRWWQRRSG